MATGMSSFARRYRKLGGGAESVIVVVSPGQPGRVEVLPSIGPARLLRELAGLGTALAWEGPQGLSVGARCGHRNGPTLSIHCARRASPTEQK